MCLRHAAELLRRDLPDGGEHRDHCVIDPDVDRAESPLNRVRGFEYRIGIGHICRRYDRRSPEPFDLILDLVQGGGVSRNQAETRSSPGEPVCDRSPHPGGCAGNHHRTVLKLGHDWPLRSRDSLFRETAGPLEPFRAGRISRTSGRATAYACAAGGSRELRRRVASGLRSDEREAGFGIPDLAQMGGTFADDHFQGRADMCLAQVPCHRAAIAFTHHEVDVKGRLA